MEKITSAFASVNSTNASLLALNACLLIFCAEMGKGQAEIQLFHHAMVEQTACPYLAPQSLRYPFLPEIHHRSNVLIGRKIHVQTPIFNPINTVFPVTQTRFSSTALAISKDSHRIVPVWFLLKTVFVIVSHAKKTTDRQFVGTFHGELIFTHISLRKRHLRPYSSTGESQL